MKYFKLERQFMLRTVSHGGQQEAVDCFVLLQRRWWGGWTPVRYNEDDRNWHHSDAPHEFLTMRDAVHYAQRRGILRVPYSTGLYT